MLAKDLSDQQIQGLRGAFSAIDPSGAGISAVRLGEVMKQCRPLSLV